MKLDTSGIDRAQLCRLLNAEYGLHVASATFLPKGEEAYGYVAEEPGGTRHFVRAQRAADVATLESVFAVTSALRMQCGLSPVVAPYPNRRGTFTCQHDGYVVAVFPFIEGATAYELGLSDEGLAQAAALVRALHASAGCIGGRLVHRETFENPFEAPILRALRLAEEPEPRANAYQQRVRRLLADERADLVATLATMRRLRDEARRLEFDWVPTHGDPNLDNFLVDARGDLHLVDWGEVALGPPERDLFFFTGERFEAVLALYAGATGTVRLHEPLFAFYTYRWTLQEIADYATRILFRNVDPDEDRHAWEELAPYLPIRHEVIQADLRAIGQVIRQVSGP